LLDAVCHLLAEITFGLLEPSGHVGSGSTELLAKGSTEPFELTSNFRFYIDLRSGGNAAQENHREPKQDKGSGEHSNQQQGLHSKWLRRILEVSVRDGKRNFYLHSAGDPDAGALTAILCSGP
jgi:hypothetical protein